MNAAWQSDWEQFVDHVAKLHMAGRDDASISAALGDKQVRWTGSIVTLAMEDEDARGLQLAMPEVRRPLGAGKTLVANFIAVAADSADVESWRRFAPGDSICFVATLATTVGPFPGISVSYDDVDDDVVLLVSLNRGRPD